jgi:hypothetical protein
MLRTIRIDIRIFSSNNRPHLHTSAIIQAPLRRLQRLPFQHKQQLKRPHQHQQSM